MQNRFVAGARERLRSGALCLGEPAARRLISADLLSLLGTTMVWTAMPFAALSIGASAQLVAAVLAVQALAILPGLLIGGIAGDRLNRRSILVGADIARFASQGAIAFLLLSGDATVWQLMLSQAVHGLGTGIFMPSMTAITPDIVSNRALQPTNSLQEVSRSFAGIAGPALGAAAVAFHGPGIAMAIDSLTFLLSAALLARLPRMSGAISRADRAASSLFDDFKEGASLFLGTPWLRNITAQFMVVNALVLAPFFVIGPLIAESEYDGATGWAVILGAIAVGEIVGAMFAISWHPERPLLASTLILPLWSIAPASLALMPLTPIIAIAAVLAGASQAIFAVLWRTTIQTKIKDPSQRSRLISFDEIGSLGVVPFGFLAGGFLDTAIGPSTALLAGVVVLIVSAALVARSSSIRELRAAPLEKADDEELDEPDAYNPADEESKHAQLIIERYEGGDMVIQTSAEESPDTSIR